MKIQRRVWIWALGWLGVIGSNGLSAGELSRGHQLLSKRGFQIQALVFPQPTGSFDLVRWQESNFTTGHFSYGIDMPGLLGPAPCMPWSRWFNNDVQWWLSPSEEAYLSSLVSLQWGDEQDLENSANVDKAAAVFAHWRQRYPEALVFTNQWGSQTSSGVLQNYMRIAQPDMVNFDTYPFDGNQTGGSPTGWYGHLQKYRQLGLSGNDGMGQMPIPYGLYLQTYNYGHIMSESEIRLNQFAAWAFGYKFSCAFVYTAPAGDDYGPNYSILFNGYGDSQPTAQFYQVKETNRQSRNLGKSLVRLLSTDVRFLPGQHRTLFSTVNNPTPSGVTTWSDNASLYIKSISAQNLGARNNGLKGDVLIGFFKPLVEDDDGRHYTNEVYFLLVNGLTDPAGSAGETQQTIHLTFDLSGTNINSLQRLSRQTGYLETVPLISDGGFLYHLDLILDGGTGDLFKFDTGAPFVVPEPVTQAREDSGIISRYLFNEQTSGQLSNSPPAKFFDSAPAGTAQNHLDFYDGTSNGPAWGCGSDFTSNGLTVGTGTGLIFDCGDQDRTRIEPWMNVMQGNYANGRSFTVMVRALATQANDNTHYFLFATGWSQFLKLEGTAAGKLIVQGRVRDGGTVEIPWDITSAYDFLLDTNKWYNLFLIYSANASLTLAVDDGLTLRSAISTTVPSGFDSIQDGFSDAGWSWVIGADTASAPTYCFDGRIESICIWDRALTTTEADAINLTSSTGSFIVAGRVQPQGYRGELGEVGLRIELLRHKGGRVRIERLCPQPDGSFTIPNVPIGTYDITIKADCWVERIINDMTIAGYTDLGTIPLTSGDVDGDNAVTSSDMALVLANLGT